MPYIPYLPYIPNIKHTILSKHAIPDRPYTPYIPNIPYHTPTTPQGEGGGQCHTPTTPQGGRGTVLGPQVAPPSPSICKLLAAFLRSSFVFARSLQHFWLPASHLLGTCYLLGGLRSTHTPDILLQSTYVLPIVIYTCAMYLLYLLPIYYLCTLTPDNTTCV